MTLDTIAPTATISLVGPATESAGTLLQYSVVFSEAVKGVDASAFSLTGSDSAAAITGFSGAGSTYTINVDPGAATGTVGLNLAGTKISDLAGNGFAGGSLQAQQSYDMGGYLYSVALADVNGDGKIDILGTWLYLHYQRLLL